MFRKDKESFFLIKPINTINTHYEKQSLAIKLSLLETFDFFVIVAMVILTQNKCLKYLTWSSHN